MPTEPRYCDHYWSMTLADFTRAVTEGTLESHEISEGVGADGH